MFPVLLGIGLLLIGGGVGLAVQYSNHKEVGEEQPVVPETIVLNDIETPEAAVNSAEVMPEPSVVEGFHDRFWKNVEKYSQKIKTEGEKI